MTTKLVERPLSDFWWIPLLRGISNLLLGLLLVTAPGITLAVLIQFVGVFWLIGGVFSIISIFVGSSREHWIWSLVRGLLGIVAGLLVLNHPLASTILLPTILVIILGIQGIIIGVMGIIEALRGSGWWMGAWGGLYLVMGILFLTATLFSVQVLVLTMGIISVLGGIVLIISAFQLRNS